MATIHHQPVVYGAYHSMILLKPMSLGIPLTNSHIMKQMFFTCIIMYLKPDIGNHGLDDFGGNFGGVSGPFLSNPHGTCAQIPSARLRFFHAAGSTVQFADPVPDPDENLKILVKLVETSDKSSDWIFEKKTQTNLKKQPSNLVNISSINWLY